MQKIIIIAGTVLATLVLGSASASAADQADTNAKIGLAANGDITFSGAPSIDFGDALIDVDGHTYNAAAIDHDLTVKNPGLVSGWTVTVKRTPFTDGKQTLNGAALTMTDGQVSSNAGNLSAAPVASEKVDLTLADQAAKVIFAPAKAGIGQFNEKFDVKKVSLAVPAGNAVGSYVSTLTWALTNAPQ